MTKKIMLLSFLVLGCQQSDHTKNPEFTEMAPAEIDIVGTYVPTADTLRFIKERGNYPLAKISIVLLKNKECRIENIPDWWERGDGSPGGNFDSGKGKWWIAERSRYWAVGLNFPSTEGFTSRKGGDQYATSIMLVGERPPYVLHLDVGDPDSGHAMHFEKVAEVND